MKFLLIGLSLSASICAGTSLLAATPPSQAMTYRRQVSDCMSKHMAASKTISYNEASKVCQEQLRTRADALTASNEAKPAKAR